MNYPFNVLLALYKNSIRTFFYLRDLCKNRWLIFIQIVSMWSSVPADGYMQRGNEVLLTSLDVISTFTWTQYSCHNGNEVNSTSPSSSSSTTVKAYIRQNKNKHWFRDCNDYKQVNLLIKLIYYLFINFWIIH